MSARELFEMLGYRYFKATKERITYKKRKMINGASHEYEITFDLEKKSYFKMLDGFGPCHVYVDEHRAINQQFKELKMLK